MIPEIINTLEESTAYCEHRNMDLGHGRQTSGNQPIRTVGGKNFKKQGQFRDFGDYVKLSNDRIIRERNRNFA